MWNWDDANGLIKLNPLIEWTEPQVRDYIRANAVPYNRLHDKGFPSIGCQPCTRAVEDGEDIRGQTLVVGNRRSIKSADCIKDNRARYTELKAGTDSSGFFTGKIPLGRCCFSDIEDAVNASDIGSYMFCAGGLEFFQRTVTVKYAYRSDPCQLPPITSCSRSPIMTVG